MYHIIRTCQPRNASLFPALAARSAWTGLESDLDRLLESAFSDLASPAASPRFAIDLYEDKDNAYVRAELPGVRREAITLELVDGRLNLSATLAQPVAGAQPDRSANWNRSIAVPVEVQAHKVSATYENGVLTVTLPKQEQAKPRKIDITVN